MSAKQSVETMTPQGTKVEITLEDWAEALIDRALERHKLECPVKVIEKRVSLLESKVGLIFWLGGPVILGILAWVGKQILDKI
jgi:hypothetical protein